MLAAFMMQAPERKHDDQFEVIEEGMVENMMLEQDVDADRSSDRVRRRAYASSDSEDDSEPDEDTDDTDRSDHHRDRTGVRKASREDGSRAGTKAAAGTRVTSQVKAGSVQESGRAKKSSTTTTATAAATTTTTTTVVTANSVDKTATSSSTSTSSDAANEPSASADARRMTDEGSDVSLTVESDEHNDGQTSASDDLVINLNNDDGENDASSKVCDSSTMSTASGEDSIDFANEPADEVDTSDVSSSFAESESLGDVSTARNRLSLLAGKKPRKRQPPIMIGYKKRRKVTHLKKLDDEYHQRNGLDGVLRVSEAEESAADDGSHHSGAFESSSSEENLFEGASTTLRPSLTRRSSSLTNEPSDKYCWTCHKDTSLVLRCLACPRVFHTKCYAQISGVETAIDAYNFQCPECVAVLKADNINTRSPTLATVNLDQLCVSLKHVIDLLKAQKDSHYFLGPVDTKEFPHYREYVTHPMELTMLEKNVSNKTYGCTEAFLADVKWIVHNSIVFNSKASKITNVAKNLLKICKREVVEIETCAECYYNSLVRIDTWFIEVCKRPHILVWARLKGYPPWPAKALKCKDNMVDCRFFGAHDKAWVPLKDCFLYSKTPPQPAKIKKSNHLDLGIQELERHIFKLKDKFGIFNYPPPRTPYQPTIELDQIRLMLPNYDPKTVGLLATKYLIHPDRVKRSLTPKMLMLGEQEESAASSKKENDTEDEKQLEDADSESTGTDDQDKPLQVPPSDGSTDTDVSTSASSSENENSTSPDDDVPAQPMPAAILPKAVNSSRAKNADESVAPSPSPAPAPTPAPSSKAVVDAPRRKSSSDESGAKSRKYVVVKNIDAINATVAAAAGRKEPTETASKVSSSTSGGGAAKVSAAASRTNATQSTTGTPSVGGNASPRSILLAKLTGARRSSVENGPKDQSSETRSLPPPGNARKESDHFDLDKVKEEPMDVDVNNASVGGHTGAEKTTSSLSSSSSKKLTKGLQSLFTVPFKSKRAAADDDSAAGPATISTASAITTTTSNTAAPSNPKKSKLDPTTTKSVNLSKTVTMSVVNRAASTAADDTRPTTTVVQAPKNDLPSNAVRSKSTPSPSPVARVVANAMTPSRSQLANRSQVKILPRPPAPPRSQSPATLTNGPISVAAAAAASRPSPIVTARTIKDASANGTANTLKVDSTSSKQSIQGLDEILLNEYQTHFKKFFEDTLDKIGGRGDLRAKIVSLQKELDAVKRSHELFVDELRREYETQIAELRATSIAKTQFDLAAERLKFEQEKEKAVKEAKSKQWCSNCQKSANYYCCWNTAYCDFECQKEHWMSHMQVCKNDVKKKAAAECSENEPPRIMMQNDVSNNYILNGYDKPGTATAYAYQNSNAVVGASRNFKRQPTKITATKAGTYRPLLPRISSTTNASSNSSTSSSSSSASSSSSSSSAVAAAAATVSSSHLTNSTQSFSENNATYPTVSSTSSLRPVPSGVPVRQAAQFLK